MNNNWLYAHCALSILVCVFSTFNKIHSKLWILHCRYMKQLLTAFSKGSHSTSTMEFRRYLLTVCDVTTMVLGNFSFPHRRHDLYTYCIYNYYMQGLSVYRWQNRVTTCLEKREMSGILLKVRPKNRQRKVAENCLLLAVYFCVHTGI